MDDLVRAIATIVLAIELTPVDHPDHATCLNNLGIALRKRFERTGSMEDLDRAITTSEQAMESIPVWTRTVNLWLKGSLIKTG